MKREQIRDAFLAEHGWDDAEISPLTPDASFRRYSRLRRADDAKAMLMDAPPPHENAAAFVAVTKHLSKLGVRVPTIFAADEAHGFLLLEDLGDETFTRLLADKKYNEVTLYQNAIDLLSRINQHADATAINLPIYDYERAIAEANLLLDWYIPARTQRPVTATARQDFAQVWAEILRDVTAASTDFGATRFSHRQLNVGRKPMRGFGLSRRGNRLAGIRFSLAFRRRKTRHLAGINKRNANPIRRKKPNHKPRRLTSTLHSLGRATPLQSSRNFHPPMAPRQKTNLQKTPPPRPKTLNKKPKRTQPYPP